VQQQCLRTAVITKEHGGSTLAVLPPLRLSQDSQRHVTVWTTGPFFPFGIDSARKCVSRRSACQHVSIQVFVTASLVPLSCQKKKILGPFAVALCLGHAAHRQAVASEPLNPSRLQLCVGNRRVVCSRYRAKESKNHACLQVDRRRDVSFAVQCLQIKRG
jgi:hypothetical protein